MRRFESGSVDEDPYWEGEDVESTSKSRPQRFLGILLISLGLISTTVAANISLGNDRIELGQGLYQIKACDQWVAVGLYPTEAIYGGLSRIDTVELVGLDPRLCRNVLFNIKIYDANDTLLSIFTGTTSDGTEGSVQQISLYDTATVSYPSPVSNYSTYAAKALTLVNKAGFNVRYADAYHRLSYVNALGNYRVKLFQPLCLVQDVARITIESSPLPS